MGRQLSTRRQVDAINPEAKGGRRRVLIAQVHITELGDAVCALRVCRLVGGEPKELGQQVQTGFVLLGLRLEIGARPCGRGAR